MRHRSRRRSKHNPSWCDLCSQNTNTEDFSHHVYVCLCMYIVVKHKTDISRIVYPQYHQYSIIIVPNDNYKNIQRAMIDVSIRDLL